MLVERSIGLLMDKWHHQDKRIEAYKEHEIQDRDAHDLIVRACDVGRVLQPAHSRRSSRMA